jgi:hypothetical protein
LERINDRQSPTSEMR